MVYNFKFPSIQPDATGEDMLLQIREDLWLPLPIQILQICLQTQYYYNVLCRAIST